MLKKIFFLIFAFSPFLIFANGVGGDIQVKPDRIIITNQPVDIITNIITYGIGIAAILGVIGITWGGIQMILAVGEDEKMKKGRYTILFSIVGVIIAGLAYSVVQLIGNLRI